MAAADRPGAGDLSQLAENLLYQLQENFQALTEKITLRNILFRLLSPEMGKRIDDLEKHVADLMTEAGIENANEELRVNVLFLFLVGTEDQDTMQGNPDRSDKPSSSTL
ncbi:unnamed protein product [Bubo scandiacus]